MLCISSDMLVQSPAIARRFSQASLARSQETHREEIAGHLQEAKPRLGPSGHRDTRDLWSLTACYENYSCGYLASFNYKLCAHYGTTRSMKAMAYLHLLDVTQGRFSACELTGSQPTAGLLTSPKMSVERANLPVGK